MSDFPYQVPVEVRFKDVDAMGHVNNAVFLTYFEQGRAGLFRDAFGLRRLEDFDFIVARIEVDYLQPVRMEDEVKVHVGVSKVGATSFALDYLLTANGEAAAKGRTIQVFYDYARRVKKPVPETFREKSAAYLLPEDGPC